MGSPWPACQEHPKNNHLRQNSQLSALCALTVMSDDCSAGEEACTDLESTRTTKESPNGPVLLNLPNKTPRGRLLLTIKCAIFYSKDRKRKDHQHQQAPAFRQGLFVYHLESAESVSVSEQPQSINTGDHISTAESLTVFLLCHRFRAPAAYLPKCKHGKEMLTATVQHLPENLMRDQN